MRVMLDFILLTLLCLIQSSTKKKKKKIKYCINAAPQFGLSPKGKSRYKKKKKDGVLFPCDQQPDVRFI